MYIKLSFSVSLHSKTTVIIKRNIYTFEELILVANIRCITSMTSSCRICLYMCVRVCVCTNMAITVSVPLNTYLSLQWRHNERYAVLNHQSHDCLLNRLFRRRSKKTSKLRFTGLCAGNSPLNAQMASKAENVSIWWRQHGSRMCRDGSSSSRRHWIRMIKNENRKLHFMI